MTEIESIKKAIRHFECMKNNAVVVLDSGFGTHPGESNSVYRNRIMYAGLAINALEKQIPKKPIFANNMMTKDKFLMCPCCEFRFPDSLVFLKTRCWNCGQKLNWSDEE